MRDPVDGDSIIRHAGSPASGGHITDIGLSAVDAVCGKLGDDGLAA